MASGKERINDLLLHMNPMIHLAGNADSTFDMLLYLSEMDPTFHKLELVKYIRKHLRDYMLGDIEKFVTEYLEEQKNKMRTDNPTEFLTAEISNKEEFTNLKSLIISELTKNSESICDGHEIGYFEDLLEEETLHDHVSPVNSSETSLNSSLNQSGFLFMHPGQYNIICDNLHNKVDPDKVLEALNMLLCVTPGEPVSQNTWPVMKKQLQNFLQVDDDEVFLKTVKFHVRLLSSQCHNAVKDGFVNLLHGIASFWVTKRLIQKLPKKNSSIIIKENKLLALIKVVLKFLQEFPMVWVRYPVKYVNEIIEKMLNCLSSCLNILPSHLPLLDVVALLDPNCLWFSSWMHGQWGRERCTDFLQRKRSILTQCFDICSSSLIKNRQEPIVPPKNQSLSGSLADHLILNHHLRLLLTTLSYSEGRKCFPLRQLQTGTHLNAKKFINFLFQNLQMSNEKLAAIAFKNLRSFMAGTETFCNMISESGSLEYLARSLIESKKEGYCHEALKLFLTVSLSQSGHDYMLGLRTVKHLGEKTYETISKFANSIPFDPKNRKLVLCTLFFTKLMKFPAGNLTLSNEPLLSTILNFVSVHAKDQAVWEEDLIHIYFRNILLYPLWIIKLDSSGLLETILEKNIHRYIRPTQTDLQLINSLSNFGCACNILDALNSIPPLWELMELVREEPLMPNITDRDLDSLLLPLTCMSLTRNGFNLILSNMAIRNSIINVFNGDALDKHTLCFLKVASSNIFISLRLSELNIQSHIIKKLKENIHEISKAIIVDEETLLLYQLLLNLLVPRGICDKFIPQFFEKNQIKFIANFCENSTNHAKSFSNEKSEISKLVGGSLNTSEWITDARKALRQDLIKNIYLNKSDVLLVMESCLDVLLQSREEKILASTGKFNLASSSSMNNKKFVEQPAKDQLPIQDATNADNSNILAVEMMIRYGKDHNMIEERDSHKPNMIQLLMSLESHVYKITPAMVDWFSLFLYLAVADDVESVFHILQDLASTRTGLILWPCIFESYANHLGVTDTLMKCNIIEATKYVLYREHPTAYLGLNSTKRSPVFMYG